MTLDANRSDLTLGIVGAGTMGRGVAQIAATAGVAVVLTDASARAAEDARAFIDKMLTRAAGKGRMSEDAARDALASITLAQGIESLARCHVVVEAIVEKLEAKQGLLRELEQWVARDCILATNTSSLSVTAIASACSHAERVAGYHFFNPVPLMKLVEVVDTPLTAEWVSEALFALAVRMGHQPVRASDTPGFIVNHAGRGYGTEALRVVGEGIAAFADVDRVMREAAGFPMGPFELLDLTGLDVSQPVMESIYHQYYEEPRFRPSVIARQRLLAGLHGRKAGAGFYAYRDGQPLVPPEDPVPALPDDVNVWVSGAVPEGREVLARALRAVGARLEESQRPSQGVLCVVTPLGTDATTAALEEGLDPGRTVAVDLLLGFDKRRTLMTTPLTEPRYRDAARALLGADGTPVTAIRDSAGFIAQRILATIVNIACDMAQQRIATPEDIDRSVTLGLRYPHGPLELGDRLGAERVLRILEAMRDLYGDPRYRPSPWLTRRARLGVSLLHGGQ
ncbi:MAG: 3-hydroxyacyl-CoA dehydrogenase [Gammaproteobacteria bacterium]|nr:3-hydroxyacyl-CoA dehydrogenase [Gammaproteobacteria bacterium]NIR84892.1 3-hydroxyacyl-CoA dehydrogenase [Gammaproteobacteria bacterium]NIR91741.1 3-hydroxyacyl-CoA dehydrogenase [Gammaproteobacteria bacterium]NIU05939.1 3-hydroxyacyl-CoA dehydrogenase [Gammaproteobacteria bacterium]NIV52986.1 3-hydroxyacyl-CoA dehydrogenase [Gammaproteobacteria bacterium]